MTASEFALWLDRALQEPVPEGVVAYSFNLSEPWKVELIGADHYDPGNSDWACPPEAFRPHEGGLRLSAAAPNDNWENILAWTRQQIVDYMGSSASGAAKLRAAQAVCVGFVDGDLQRVWP